MQVVSAAAAFDDACHDLLLRERFCQTWERVASLVVAALPTVRGGARALLNETCIFTSSDAVPTMDVNWRYAFNVHSAGTLQLEIVGVAPEYVEEGKRLFGAIADTASYAFEHALRFHALAASLAHELTIILTGTGMAMKSFDRSITALANADGSTELAKVRTTQDSILAESQLGLYVVRNFLAHIADPNVGLRPRHRVDLNELLSDMVELHGRVASRRGIEIEAPTGQQLPPILGDADELRRALHNLLNNAVKYSYGSQGSVRRAIRIERRAKHDPGFRNKSCAIVISNYGLGVSEEEARRVFVAGFRGRQARDEVATGSGIGLSEVEKIARAHGGRVTLRSRPLHEDTGGEPTYLTVVTLILPSVATTRES